MFDKKITRKELLKTLSDIARLTVRADLRNISFGVEVETVLTVNHPHLEHKVVETGRKRLNLSVEFYKKPKKGK